MNRAVSVSKVIDIKQARRRHLAQGAIMNDAGSEMREETRHASYERLFVQVVECADRNLVGMTVSCDLFLKEARLTYGLMLMLAQVNSF